MTQKQPFLIASVTVLAACAEFDPGPEFIESHVAELHAWGPYHWGRTTSSFDLLLVDSTTSDWDGYVSGAVADWSASTKVNLVEIAGSEAKNTRRRCDAPDGRVRVCNLEYGQTGWLGVAGISVDPESHIVRAYTKVNDTYFSWDYYNTPTWKQSVICQELGHDLGLDHQDEDFDNESLLSCMDYQDPPYEFPNDHDYEQLELVYGHLDIYDSYDDGGGDGGGGDGGGGGGNGECKAPPGKGCNKGVAGADFGQSLGRRGRHEAFVKPSPDGMEVTYVIWADGF